MFRVVETWFEDGEEVARVLKEKFSEMKYAEQYIQKNQKIHHGYYIIQIMKHYKSVCALEEQRS